MQRRWKRRAKELDRILWCLITDNEVGTYGEWRNLGHPIDALTYIESGTKNARQRYMNFLHDEKLHIGWQS